MTTLGLILFIIFVPSIIAAIYYVYMVRHREMRGENLWIIAIPLFSWIFIFVLLWNILKQFVKLFIPKKEEINEQA